MEVAVKRTKPLEIKTKVARTWRKCVEHRYLFLMLLPVLAYYLIFTYATGYLAAWTSDLMQYEDPGIPQEIRDLTEEERDYRIANWKAPEINWAVQSIDVPEKQEMAAVTFMDDWTKFIMDTSGKSDEELYEEMKKNWDANGYAAAVDAITAKAEELGIE